MRAAVVQGGTRGFQVGLPKVFGWETASLEWLLKAGTAELDVTQSFYFSFLCFTAQLSRRMSVRNAGCLYSSPQSVQDLAVWGMYSR